MNWSVAEVMALATKAARGGGAPPAQAARFGQVAALHLMTGRDPSALAGALDRLPEGPILTYPLALDAACAEAAVSDGRAHVLTGPPDALLDSYSEALPFAADLQADGTGILVLTVDFAQPRPRAIPRRITGCEALLGQMQVLAERTYVPETAQSRLSGAGAGLTDND